MKTDNQPGKSNFEAKEILLTALVFGLMSAALLGGSHMIGIISLPAEVLPFIGGALVAYVVVAGIAITFMCAKFIFKKG